MASQKGGNLATLVGLILSIFVIVILIFLCVNLDSQIEKVQKDLEGEVAKTEVAEKKFQAERKRLLAVYEVLTGKTDLPSEDAGAGVFAEAASIKKDSLDAAQAALRTILDQETYGTEDFKKALKAAGDGRITDRNYTNLKELYRDLERMLSATVPELNRLRVEKDKANEELRQAQKSAAEDRRNLQSDLSTQRQKYSRLELEKIQQAKDHDAEKRRLLDEKDAIQQEMEKLREEAFIVEARLQSTISKLEERIREMNEKQKRSLADTDADGEIVHANQRLGLAWVNLGHKHRLRRGLTFDVFQYIKGGERKKKGMIEVKRVDDETAEVAILEQYDPVDPIVKGDLVSSPFFDKKKEMVFVFVGEGLTNDRYERSQLERRIRDFGGRVDDVVTIDTDFVIAIKNAEQSPEFAKAVQFGVVIMREDELLDFIGQ